MRNDNLSRTEALDRSRLLTIRDYDVHVDLTGAADPDMPAFPVRATIRFDVDSADPAGEETFLEYIHHSVDRIELNGRILPKDEVLEGSRIRLRGLAATNEVTVHGHSWYSRSGEGLHRFLDPEDGRTYLYTQYEPADCRRVFPTFEQPDLKAVFRFAVTAPKDWAVASNAELVRELPDPVDETISKRVFAPTLRISTYITTLLAGQYHAVGTLYRPRNPELEPKPVTLYCRQAMAEHLPADELFRLVAGGLDFFQDLFDYPYPFPKYDQAFVPEYNLGAMENPGLVTFTEDYLFPGGATEAQREARANVVMHEMSHMWFGDLVTMSWWSDLWLKESFAEFMGALGAERAAGFDEAWVSFAHGRKAWAYAQDAHSTTHPIVADIPDVEAAKQNFDGITYAKGASVLKQLVAFVGFEEFVAAARAYFRAHAFGTAELTDFLAALEEASGRDLGAWSEAWLRTAGVTGLSVRGSGTEAELVQEFPEIVPATQGRPHRLAIRAWRRTDASGSLEQVFHEDREIPAERDAAPVRLPLPEADLVLVNQDDLTYALTGFRGAQADAAVEHGHRLPQPIDRAVLGGALWAMVRDASLPPRRYLDHALAVLREETSATILTTTLRHAVEALEAYTPEAERAAGLDDLGRAVLEGFRAAEPGSDRQRILARQGLRIARGTDVLRPLAEEVLAAARGGADLDGLEVGDELAWSSRIAEVARGRLEEQGIEEAYAARPTRHAAVGRAQALATVPDRAAKERAWDEVLSSTLSNDLLSATAAGFMTGPSGLREGFEDRYFEILLPVWEKESIGMASRIVQGLCPDPDAVPDVADRIRAWLEEHPKAPGALRRLLVEAAEDAERALRIRAAARD